MKQRRARDEPGKTLTRDHLRRIAAVAHARDLEFVELVGLAELDPAAAFRGAIIRGADLRGQDLSGFDLTGARLIDCRTTGLDLSRAQGVTEATLAGSEHDDTVRLPPAFRNAFWATDVPPSWAEDWGRDKYGPWVSFCVPGTDVRQRMRWIPPGKFMMGSSEDEKGDFGYDAPLHLVTIIGGFWMFETPCREELWRAVMRQMPRRSRGPAFPMTGLSWTEATDFAARLNEALPGIALELPSEARWDYAFRAGTTTSSRFGKRASRTRVLYDLDNSPAEVASLPPNAWGLHELRYDLQEWCQDDWHHFYNGVPDDGSAWTDPPERAEGHVIRGRSWDDDALGILVANRHCGAPGDRSGNLGFRCVRVGSETEQAAPADSPTRRKR